MASLLSWKGLKEAITPQNEEAQRQAAATLQRTNEMLAQGQNFKYGQLAAPQARQQFVQRNQAPQFSLAKTGVQVGGDVALNTFAGGVKRFGQSVASTMLTPYSNHLADQERARAERLLNPAYKNLYGAYGYDPRLGANQASLEADAADYGIRTDPLLRNNIGVNDSLKTVTRKVGAQGLEAFLDIALAGKTPAAFRAAQAGKSFKPSIAAGALLGGGGNAAYLAQQDQLRPQDALSVLLGAGIGATLPALGGIAGNPKVGKAVKRAASLDTPEITQLKAQKASSIKAMDTAKGKMLKQHVANVNNIDAQIKKLKERGSVQIPGGGAVGRDVSPPLPIVRGKDAPTPPRPTPNPYENLGTGDLMARNYIKNLQARQGEGAQLPSMKPMSAEAKAAAMAKARGPEVPVRNGAPDLVADLKAKFQADAKKLVKPFSNETGAISGDAPKVPTKKLAGGKPKIAPPSTTTKKTEVGLNTERLGLSDSQKAIVKADTSEGLERLSNKEVQSIADSAGIDTSKVGRAETKKIIAEQLNLRRKLVETHAKADAALKAGDLEGRAKLLEQAAEEGRISRGQGTDIARQLQARTIIADELKSPHPGGRLC